MGIIARIFDFVGGTKIKSADIDAEFNQLVTAHNDHDTKIDALQAGTGLTNGAVTNPKVAPGIDMVKIADGSVTNTEVQFINSLTSNAQNQLDAKIPLTQKGVALGVVPLDSSAKIDTIYIPDSVLGQLEYKGTYNATTNIPTLPAAASSKGFYYVVSTGGTVSGILYAVGDWIVSNGTAWEKVDNTDAVTTVFGRSGAIVPNANDYTWAQIDKAASSFADITTRSASDINAGVLPVSRVPSGIPATSIGNADVTNTILSFLNTLTSNAQTQINNKAPLTHVGAGGSSEHPDATTSLSGFISAADLNYLRSLVPSGLASYSVPVGQIFSLWSKYSQEQDPVTGDLVFYEI